MASKLSGTAGELGDEATELRDWLLSFGCASEEFRVVLTDLSDWMANFSPPWAYYRALMACRLVAMDKRPGVRPVGIGETLRQAITKLIIKTVGDQAKAACGSLQLCAGLEAGIEEANHAVTKRQQERHTPDTEGGADEVSEGADDQSAATLGGTERAGGVETVVGIGEFPRPPGERSTAEEGERGEVRSSDELITAMEGMEVGGEEIYEGEEAEVEQYDAEAEEGGSGGGPSGTESHRDPDSGC